MINQDYIRAIGQKLDNLKKQEGESNPHANLRSNQGFDPIKDAGDAGIAWLKKQGKWPINGGQSHL